MKKNRGPVWLFLFGPWVIGFSMLLLTLIWLVQWALSGDQKFFADVPMRKPRFKTIFIMIAGALTQAWGAVCLL